MEAVNQSTDNHRYLIREAIRKIALGRSLERVDMSPGGISGIGTARMIHGDVAKVHSDPSDKEFGEYAGTVDVGEYPHGTASSEPVIHKGVLPAARFRAHTEISIGVTETEEIDTDSDSSPDYDELEPTGNESYTRYTKDEVITKVCNQEGKEASATLQAEGITHIVDKSEVKQTAEKVVHNVNGTTISVSDKKVTLGDENATEPLVLGNELAQLMLDFLTECSKITTPTLMGTMPAINIPNFTSLTSRIQKFLSKTSYTK